MARNDFRRFREPSVDRAPPRAGADSAAESWRTLANAAVASTLVAAVVVSALALLEAVFSTSTVRLARHAPQPQSSHARAATHEPFLPTPVQAEPAWFVAE
jgi:hypothetical protein